MAEAIRGAKRHVHVCSWNLAARLRSRPAQGDPGARAAGRDRRARPRARDRLGRRAGARSSSRAAASSRPRASELVRGTKIQCQLDSCTRMMHCHHEKLVIVDDELAFVGGIDLTALAGDRYDSNEHPHKEDAIGWHDASSLLRGPIVRDVAAHFAMRWEATAGEALPLPEDLAPAGDTTVQFVRTVPEGAYRVAAARRVLACWRPTSARCARAQRLIYLENQFLWSPEIVHILETQAAQPAVGRLPRRRPAPAQGQQRPGRHARDARPPGGRRRRRQALPRHDDRVALRRALRPAVRAREDRHRRRRVAGDRLGQPQRALAVQRHRGRRRHLRPGARPRHPAAAVGGAPRAGRRRRRSGATSSTSSGARSRPSSSSAGAPARRSPTTSSSCRASRAARGGCSARSTRSVVDGCARRRRCGCRARARGPRGAT